MSPTENIPLLVLVLVLLCASGAGPQTMNVIFGGQYGSPNPPTCSRSVVGS